MKRKMGGIGCLVVGATLVVGSLLSKTQDRCLYFVETPTRTDAYLSLQDAYQAMQNLGIDPRNTPDGYDVTSKTGC
jgi:hypothetical protein